MRKMRYTVFICIIFAVLLIFCACANDSGPSYKVTEHLVFENSGIIRHRENKHFFFHGKFQDETAPVTADIEFYGENYHGTYLDSERVEYNSFKTAFYVANAGDVIFGLSNTGTLVYWENDPGKTVGETVITEQDCIDKTEKIVFALTDVSEFEREIYYSPEDECYTVSYIKFTDGIKMYNRIMVKIRNDGEILLFSYRSSGNIKSKEIESFDTEKAVSAVNEKLFRMYRRVSGKEGYTVDTEITDLYAVRDIKEEPVMMADVEVTVTDRDGGTFRDAIRLEIVIK